MPTLIESTDGVGVALHELGGPAGGPVLLLVHTNGFNAGAWRPMAAALVERGHRVVAVDLRGHGESRTSEGLDFAWSGFADDVVAVLDDGALGAGPDVAVHGIGHSLGGAALLAAAARRPGALRSLWVFEPIAPPPGSFGPSSSETGEISNPMAEGARRRRPGFESVEAAIANYGSKPPMAAFHPDALRGYVEGGVGPDPGGGGGVVLRCRPEWEAAIFTMTGGSPAWDALPDVDLPVTVVVGGEVGGPGPSMFAPAVAERLPRGHLVRHPELTHFGPFEAPDLLAAEVDAWVRGG